MLFSGSRGAPYTCLRCQLRQAIFQSRRRCIDRTRIETARSFSARTRHQSQEDDSTIHAPRGQHERPYVYHYPLGRIVGGPGRRQRQGTQKLKIDAMKRPFEVIVMQDVREPEKKELAPLKRPGEQSLTAAQIEREMQREGQEVTQEEVNEAIRAFRPDTTLLEEEQYKELAQSLTSGFTTEQLYGFLTHSLNLSAIEGDTVHLLREKPTELQTRYRRTQWRAGKTRLEKRLPVGSVIKKSERNNKPKVVEQILRLLWNLSIHAEEQRVGELEMKMEGWELAYLFDLPASRMEKDSTTMYESLVDSPFLLRVCNVRPYRSHGYLRISGRRQDAEEVAQKLEARLPLVGQLDVQLSSLSPYLGSPGWPKTMNRLFRSDDISYIQRRTLAIIEQPKHDVLHIHGQKQQWREEARRLLLGLLDLPTPGSTRVLDNVTAGLKEAVALPEAVGDAVHFRHRKLDLTRLAMPIKRHISPEQPKSLKKKVKNDASHFISSATAKIIPALGNAAPVGDSTQSRGTTSYWEAYGRQPSWRAHFYRALNASRDDASALIRRGKKKGSDTTTTPKGFTIEHRQTHHLEELLSFFKPRQFRRQSAKTRISDPILVARFIPSPIARSAKGTMNLPPIELTYSFDWIRTGAFDVELVGAQAMVDKQVLRVPLPSEITDLQFERSERLRANVANLLQQKGIQEFDQALRASAQKAKASLVGKPEVHFQLPAAMLQEDRAEGDAEEPAVHVPYLFMGFEQKQTMHYQPLAVGALPPEMDIESKNVLASFGNNLFLQVTEVLAGSMGGRRTEVSLHQQALDLGRRRNPPGDEAAAALGDPAEADDDARDEDRSEGQQAEQKLQEQSVKCALGVARLLTKLGSGELHARLRTQKAGGDRRSEEKEPEKDETSAGVRGE